MTEIKRKMSSTQPDKREWHGTHHSWCFSPQAFRWTGEYISGPNFLPLATEMRAWMLQLGHLSLMPPLESPSNGGYTNNYTESGITLTLLMSNSVTASHHFATSLTANESEDEVSAELERIRLHNELLINSARFCEAVIKQLLHCTQIPASLYQRMALGQLLESPCPYCNKKKDVKSHSISLVGTLACPFGLCHAFEHCAMNHMNLVNKLRNTQAAHSEVQTLNIRSVSASKKQLYQDCDAILNDFLHMLLHLQELEQAILVDLAKMANVINHLKRSGLPPEDCNFELAPGQPFVFDPTQEKGITH